MARYTLFLTLIGLVMAGCRQQPATQPWQTRLHHADLNEGEFTEIVASAIRETISDASVRVSEPLTLVVTVDSHESQCNLDNAWRDFDADPKTRLEVVKRLVAALQAAFRDQGKSATIDLKEVVPVIKDQRWLEETKRQGVSIYHEHLAADIFVTYAQDGPSQLRFVTSAEVEQFGLTPEDMRARCVHNLMGRLPRIERMGEGPLYMLAAGGTFESSLLVMPEVWRSQEDAVDGRIVVAIPSRELILFTGENAAESIQQMRSSVAEIHSDGNYLISETILVRENGRWQPLDPEPPSSD